MTTTGPLTAAVLEDLSARAAESESAWPSESFRVLADAGVLGFGVPVEYGGTGASFDLTAAYVDLAAADLITCFVLTQQNSAVSRLAASENEAVKQRWLPKIAVGDAFATVGISHLTTSRQHVAEPPVRIEESADGYVLNGRVPWSTSAGRADVVVVGGTLADGRELLIAVNTDQPGWQPAPSMSLLALTASETGEIVLDNVRASADELLAGPVEGVMKTGAGGAGSLTTSALAVGLSQRAIVHLAEEAERRDDVDAVYQPLRQEFDALKGDLLADADKRSSAEAIRTQANSLALRSTQALMTACKGAGFVVGHPAERACREAMFFLVWSCPRPVAAAAMQEFACRPFCGT